MPRNKYDFNSDQFTMSETNTVINRDWNRHYVRFLAKNGIGLLTEQEAIRRNIRHLATQAPHPSPHCRDPYPICVFVPLDEANIPVPTPIQMVSG